MLPVHTVSKRYHEDYEGWRHELCTHMGSPLCTLNLPFLSVVKALKYKFCKHTLYTL